MRILPAILAALFLSLPAQAQTIFQSGNGALFVPAGGSRLTAALDPFGDLTLVAPPRQGGPFVYNPRTGTLSGPGFTTITIPGSAASAGLPLFEPVSVLGF